MRSRDKTVAPTSGTHLQGTRWIQLSQAWHIFRLERFAARSAQLLLGRSQIPQLAAGYLVFFVGDTGEHGHDLGIGIDPQFIGDMLGAGDFGGDDPSG